MKIKISTLLLYISMALLLFPQGIRRLLGIPASTVMVVQATVVTYLVTLMFRKKQVPSKPFIILILIYVTAFISAFLHGTLRSLLFADFAGFAMCFGFEYWLRNYFKQTIRCLFYILSFLAFINIFIILLFPNGLFNAVYNLTFDYATNFNLSYNLNWIFGYKNDQFGYLLALLAIATVYSYISKGKITLTCKIVYAICFLNELFARATMATLLTIFFITIMLVIIKNYNRHFISMIMRVVNVRTIVIMTSVIVFAVVISTSDNFISRLLGELAVALGKDRSFNGRADIWLTAINYIKDSPIIGYGDIDAQLFVRDSGILGGTHAHNYILHILIRGGIICLIEHIVLYSYTIKRIVRDKGVLANVIGLVIGTFFLDGLTSVNIYYILFNPMFILAYYTINYYPNKIKILAKSA